ncbi:MAG: hypothetical protein ABI433_11010 [Burkholderiaceae bacterium]
MQTGFGEFFESVNDAMRETVRQLGGHKKIGPMLWPEQPIEQASNRLRDCLNPDRRENLSPEQVLLLLRLARTAGYHGAMAFLACDAGYETPRPVAPEDKVAALQNAFVDAVEKLDVIQRELKRAQIRSVA